MGIANGFRALEIFLFIIRARESGGVEPQSCGTISGARAAVPSRFSGSDHTPLAGCYNGGGTGGLVGELDTKPSLEYPRTQQPFCVRTRVRDSCELSLRTTRINERPRARALQVKLLRHAVTTLVDMGYRGPLGFPNTTKRCKRGLRWPQGSPAGSTTRQNWVVGRRSRLEQSGFLRASGEARCGRRRSAGQSPGSREAIRSVSFRAESSQPKHRNTGETKALPRGVPGLPVGDVPVRGHQRFGWDHIIPG